MAALSVLLVACGEGLGVGGNAPQGPSPLARAVTVTAGEVPVVIAGPKGFCVDKPTIDNNPRGSFMFLTDCQIADKASQPSRLPLSAIVTVSVAPSGLPGREAGLTTALDALKGFLQTPAGLFSLSKSNTEGAVTILETKRTQVALYLLIEDAAYRGAGGASQRYWRAFSEVNGRLVTLSVTGFAKHDPDEERAAKIIRDFMQEIIDANPAPQA